jgi:hypothetical protein
VYVLPFTARSSQPDAVKEWLHVARAVHFAAEAALRRAPAGSDIFFLLRVTRVSRAAAYRAMAGHLGLCAVLPPSIILECPELPRYWLHLPRHCFKSSTYKMFYVAGAPCDAVIRAHMAVVYAHLMPMVKARKSDPALRHARLATVRFPKGYE